MNIMKYQNLNNSFYTSNRAAVVSELEINSTLILTSHDEYPRSGDTTFPFRQNSELLYLTGIDQEETYLILAPWHPNPDYREILFIKNPSPEMIIWYGHRFSKEQASEISGIKTILFSEQFDSILQDIMVNSFTVYLHIPENPRMKVTHPTQEIRFAEKLKKRVSSSPIQKSSTYPVSP